MTELKTLCTIKDIPLNIIGNDPDDIQEHWAKKELLEQIRNEAKKHIDNKECNNGFRLTPDTIFWIKHFFNLEEKE